MRYIRLAEIIEGGDPLGGHFLYVLEYDIGVGAIWQRNRRRGCKLCVCLAVGLENVLLRGRVPRRHGDCHAEGCLGLVDRAQRALLVDLGVGAVWLHVLRALLLAARKCGYGEGGPRAVAGSGIGGLLGGVGQRQGGRRGPPV